MFPRADQFRRFRAYLIGLLSPADRRNVEAIAAHAATHTPASGENLIQALQHFVSHSPWEADRLCAAYRRAVAGRLADPAGAWVVHDGVFPKKGRHSAGARRQFSRTAGRKLSCQVAVVVSQVGPGGYFPLAARLYLPAGWLRDNPESASRVVPEPHRRSVTKAEVALALLGGLRDEGLSPVVVAADGGYEAADGFRQQLAAWGWRATNDLRQPREAVTRFEWLKRELGLDHFEGRTWLGWHHHVALVFAAYAFLVAEGLGPDQPPFRGDSVAGC